jgi:hypothetical protein
VSTPPYHLRWDETHLLFMCISLRWRQKATSSRTTKELQIYVPCYIASTYSERIIHRVKMD